MKLPNRLILSFLCSVICLLLTAPSLIHAQDQRPLYLLTSNVNSRLSSIWEYEVGDAQATRIFTLQQTQRKNGDLFSAHELAAMRTYVKDYGRGEIGWGEDYSPTQDIWAIWQLDSQHLLLQTTNDFQDGWGRTAATAGLGRFGYYEFLILDLTTWQLKSIFTMDYHDPITNDWEGTSIPFVQITGVQINPTQNQLALMLIPTSRWLTTFESSILIVNYSTLPAKVTHLPRTYSPVWSLDGTRLAYWQTQCECKNNEVTTFSLALQIYTPAMSVFTTAMVYPKLTDRIPLDGFTHGLAWIANDKFIYSLEMIWLGGGDRPQEEIFDLNTNTRIPFETKNLIPRIFFTFGQGGEPTYLLGRGYDDTTANVYSTDSSFKMLLSLPVSNATYNPRNPDRVIIYPVNNSMTDEKQVILLDADLHQTPIEISKILPADEWFFDNIAP
ncbi:MAG: hypothetical protein ABI690_25550 [Chloroflexota bacterium]